MSHRHLGNKLSPRSSLRRNNSQYWAKKKKGDVWFFLFEFFTEYLKSTHRTMLKEEREYKKKKIHKAKNGMERAVGKGE